MICLIFPSAYQLALTGLLQAGAKLSAFKYENKENRKSNNKDQIGHPLKRHLRSNRSFKIKLVIL